MFPPKPRTDKEYQRFVKEQLILGEINISFIKKMPEYFSS